MTDWTKIVADAQANAKAQDEERAARAAKEREAENARRADFASAIQSIVAPTIVTMRNALQSALHTEFHNLDKPPGIVLKAWNVSKVPPGKTISDVPACEFKIVAVERSTKARLSTSYGLSGVQGAHEEREQSEITQAWLDAHLKTFITNVIAPG